MTNRYILFLNKLNPIILSWSSKLKSDYVTLVKCNKHRLFRHYFNCIRVAINPNKSISKTALLREIKSSLTINGFHWNLFAIYSFYKRKNGSRFTSLQIIECKEPERILIQPLPLLKKKTLWIRKLPGLKTSIRARSG